MKTLEKIELTQNDLPDKRAQQYSWHILIWSIKYNWTYSNLYVCPYD